MVEKFEWTTNDCKEVLSVHYVTVGFVHGTWWSIQTPQRGLLAGGIRYQALDSLREFVQGLLRV